MSTNKFELPKSLANLYFNMHNLIY